MVVNWSTHKLLELSPLWDQSLHNLVPYSQHLLKLIISDDVRSDQLKV